MHLAAAADLRSFCRADVRSARQFEMNTSACDVRDSRRQPRAALPPRHLEKIPALAVASELANGSRSKDDAVNNHSIEEDQPKYTVEWRVARRGRPPGWTVQSATFGGAAAARAFALRSAVDAYGGEFRIARLFEGRTAASVYSTAYEIEGWQPGDQIIPARANSTWELGERRRDHALLIYNRVRRALSEAAGADLIRRSMSRQLRQLLRSVLIDGSDQFGDGERMEELKRKA